MSLPNYPMRGNNLPLEQDYTQRIIENNTNRDMPNKNDSSFFSRYPAFNYVAGPPVTGSTPNPAPNAAPNPAPEPAPQPASEPPLPQSAPQPAPYFQELIDRFYVTNMTVTNTNTSDVNFPNFRQSAYVCFWDNYNNKVPSRIISDYASNISNYRLGRDPTNADLVIRYDTGDQSIGMNQFLAKKGYLFLTDDNNIPHYLSDDMRSVAAPFKIRDRNDTKGGYTTNIRNNIIKYHNLVVGSNEKSFTFADKNLNRLTPFNITSLNSLNLLSFLQNRFYRIENATVKVVGLFDLNPLDTSTRTIVNNKNDIEYIDSQNPTNSFTASNLFKASENLHLFYDNFATFDNSNMGSNNLSTFVTTFNPNINMVTNETKSNLYVITNNPSKGNKPYYLNFDNDGYPYINRIKNNDVPANFPGNVDTRFRIYLLMFPTNNMATNPTSYTPITTDLTTRTVSNFKASPIFASGSYKSYKNPRPTSNIYGVIIKRLEIIFETCNQTNLRKLYDQKFKNSYTGSNVNYFTIRTTGATGAIPSDRYSMVPRGNSNNFINSVYTPTTPILRGTANQTPVHITTGTTTATTSLITNEAKRVAANEQSRLDQIQKGNNNIFDPLWANVNTRLPSPTGGILTITNSNLYLQSFEPQPDNVINIKNVLSNIYVRNRISDGSDQYFNITSNNNSGLGIFNGYIWKVVNKNKDRFIYVIIKDRVGGNYFSFLPADQPINTTQNVEGFNNIVEMIRP